MKTQNSKPSKADSERKPKRRNLLNTLSLKRSTTIPATCGDQSDTPTVSGSAYIPLVSSIRDLPLKHFIACQVDSNLSVLGNGTDLQLQAAWMRLLSEYYCVMENAQARRYIELVCGMEAIKFRAAYIDFLLATLSELYTQEIADILHKEHPAFTFSRETYIQEITYVQNIEKRHKGEYDNLKLEFDKLESSNSNGKETKRLDYIEQLLDINKHEHASYTENMSTELFALCLKRLERHYRMLEEQAEKNKR